jgi:CBS domain-containing protein
VSSLPIVDDHGSLIDIYSRSDITALARDRSYAHLQLDVVTVTQALQIGAQDWGNGPVGPRTAGSRLHMCVRSESLRTVIELLAHPGVRRVICIEAGSNRVEGIISLKDVFNFLLGQ